MRFASATATPSDYFDPARQLSNFEILVTGNIYDSLLYLDGAFKAHPGILKSWEPSADGIVWTLKMRDGAVFHDGSPVTAKDLEYSIARNLDPEAPSPVVGLLGPYLKKESIEVVDESTLRLTLESPYAFLPVILGNRYMRVIKAGATDFKNPIGTGPYSVAAHQAGQSLELVRNDKYWGAKPTLERIKSRNIPESSSRLQAMLAGEVDAVESIDYGQVPTVKKSSKHRLVVLEEALIPTVDLDVRVKPFNDKRVLQAIKLSIDRQQLVDTVFHGMASVASDSLVAPSDPFFNQELAAPKRDIAKAKELLREAGYPNGFTHDFIVSEVGPSVTQFGVALSEQLADAGINFKIQQTPPSTYWNNTWMKASASTPFLFRRHPDEMLTYFATTKGAYNGAHWSNQEFDAAVADARKTLDLDKQKAAFSLAQKLHASEGGNLMPVYSHVVASSRTGFPDFGPSPMNLLTFAAAGK